MAGFRDYVKSKFSSSSSHYDISNMSSTNEPPGSVSLGFQLLSQLSTPNAVVSPGGVHVALQLASLGATKKSACETELTQILGVGDGGLSISSKTDQLTMATAAYVTEDVKPAYKTACKNMNAAVETLPSTVVPINSWVKSATKGKIPEIISSIPDGSKAVLLSAVHFAAPWASAFDKKDTEKAEFIVAGAKTNPKVEMMNRYNAKYHYAQGEMGANNGVEVIALPYEGGKFCAVIVLPAENVGLDTVVKTLGGKDGASVYRKTLASVRSTDIGCLSVPRFKVEWNGSLKESLQTLGMKAPFVGNAFDEMASNTSISDVVHKAFIECTEKGTVAAAATAVMVGRSMRPQKVDFIANRPFLFAVHSGEEILFASRVDSVVSPA